MTSVRKVKGAPRRVVVAVAALAVAAGGACSRHGDQGRSEIAARVNGKAIPMTALSPAVAKELAKGKRLGKDPSSSTAVASATREKLQAAIDQEVLVQASEKLSVPDLDAQVKARVAELAVAMAPPAPGQAAPELTSEMKENVRRNVLVENYLRANGIFDPAIPDEEIAKFYEANKAGLRTVEARRVSHILIKVAPDAPKEQADAALARIVAVRKAIVEKRETFEDAARKSSECSTARIGGDLGDVQRGYMPKPFEDLAFALPVGKLSDVVRTQHGFHVLKVVSITPSKLPTLADSHEFISKYLKEGVRKQKVAEHIAMLKKQAKIEIYL